MDKNTDLSGALYDVYDLVPEVKQRSFYLLKEYTQDPVKYQLFTNLQITGININFSVKSFIQLVFNLMGGSNLVLTADSPVPLDGRVPVMTIERFVTAKGFLKFNGAARNKCSDAALTINNNIESIDALLFQTKTVEKYL
ncbi:MAG: hypothetical protein LBQ88_19600 [Treponema sp.]|nr:hypothetical protein [Treponema sp.]